MSKEVDMRKRKYEIPNTQQFRRIPYMRNSYCPGVCSMIREFNDDVETINKKAGVTALEIEEMKRRKDEIWDLLESHNIKLSRKYY